MADPGDAVVGVSRRVPHVIPARKLADRSYVDRKILRGHPGANA